MKNTNVTEYQSEPDGFQMYYGKVSLGDEFYVATGDECFYHLMGGRNYYSILELLHPEDVEDFMDAVEKLAKQPQCLIARIMCSDGYRCFYMVLKENGRVIRGFRSFDIEFCEFMLLTKRYLEYSKTIKKYREFLTLYSGMFFEYEYPTDVFKFYEYHNVKGRLLYDGTMEETRRKVQKNPLLNSKQQAEFEILYETIKKGRDQFKVEFDAAVIFEQSKEARYELKCSTMYKDDIRDMVVGMAHVINGKEPKKSYYLSENAVDPGTGLLNKRAINEYAIEKIQEQTKGLRLAIIDVDDFKQINDSYGHMYGDEVLSKTAEIIRSAMKGWGVVGRFGGDEFMVVFENMESETDLRRVIGTFCKHTQWAFAEKEGLKVTYSIGISKYPEDGTTYEELFQKADKCLYIAKAKGKNRFIIYMEERHGCIVNNIDSVRNIGMKAMISDDKKNDMVSELILMLHRNGMKEMEFVMRQMQDYFDIDGVALYAGEDMKRIAASGKYINPVSHFCCIFEKEYQKLFDEQGYYTESNLQRLLGKSRTAYDLNERQEIQKFIQCVSYCGDKPAAVVSFDFFNRRPKFGTMDSGLIKLVGRLMAEVTAESSMKLVPFLNGTDA